MTSAGDTDENYQTCRQLALSAADANCRMLFLPECFSLLGSSYTESIKVAQTLDGPFLQKYKALAREVGLWLSLGGFQVWGCARTRGETMDKDATPMSEGARPARLAWLFYRF